MVSGQVSVPSSNGPVSFTVTGTNTLAYAQAFANALNNALTAGTLGYLNLSNSSATIPGYPSASSPTVIENEITSSGSYTLPADTAPGGVYTFVDVDGAVTVTGSGSGDDVLVGDSVTSAGAATSYYDVGGNNIITFANGNNTYFGDTLSSAGSDAITAGSGDDSIYTGAGMATVDSGTGDATIVLRDTLAAGATSQSVNPADYNQFVYLDDGSNTVYMEGVADIAVATAPDQTIYGGPGTDQIALVSPVGDSVIAVGDNTVIGGSAYTGIFDDSEYNTIYGGTGASAVTAVNVAPGVDVTFVSGTGTNLVYGSAGDTINYYADTTPGTSIFIGGSGAESVDASGSTASIVMVLGTGNETLVSGAGYTVFNANYDSATGLTGSITIDDFGGSDMFNFVGYSASQAGSIATGGTQTSAGYQITLSDGTKVTFAGVTSIEGHYTNS